MNERSFFEKSRSDVGVETALFFLTACLAFLWPRAGQAKPSWVLAYDSMNQDNAIIALSAVDGQHAWAVGYESQGSQTTAIGVATADGVSFGSFSLPNPGGSQFEMTIFLALAFADTQTGWLFGSKVGMQGETHYLWKSENSGMSWSEAFQPSEAMADLQAFSGGQLFGVGGETLLYSLDGQQYEEVTVPVDSGMTLEKLFMFNPDCGFVIARSDPEDGPVVSAVLWTADGGQTWETRADNLDYSLGGVWFVSPDLGWAAATQGETGLVLKTTDGGRSWTPQSMPDHPPPPMGQDPAPVTDCSDVRFFDDTRGVALCLSCTANCDGQEGNPSYLTVFCRTADGGATWEMDPDYEPQMVAEPFGDMAKFSGMFNLAFPDVNNGFMAGQNNIILAYTADDPEQAGWPMPECSASNNNNGNTNSNNNGNNNGNQNGNSSQSGDNDAALSGCGCRGLHPATPSPFSCLLILLLFGWGATRLWQKRF
jgi:hypothetical protein